jgi:hypothetical protein
LWLLAIGGAGGLVLTLAFVMLCALSFRRLNQQLLSLPIDCWPKSNLERVTEAVVKLPNDAAIFVELLCRILEVRKRDVLLHSRSHGQNWR